MNWTTTYCSLTISISLQGNRIAGTDLTELDQYRIAGDLVHIRKC